MYPSQAYIKLMSSPINNNFKMINQKLYFDEVETFAGSPQKPAAKSPLNEDLPTNCISLERGQLPMKMSETEMNLYSRELVQYVMQNNKDKTIRHEINQISKDSRLYARPARYNPKEFQFEQIPPQNPHYSSSCSAKIKYINRGLHSQSVATTDSRTTANNSMTSLQGNQPKVSISGLVSYKFHSVNPQRSLGFNQINHQETMKEAIKISHKASSCAGNRFKAILQKTNHKRHRQLLRKDNNVMSNFNTTTSDHLKQRIKEDEQEMLVYGQKAKKLNYIKEYMLSEKTTYEEGRHIIDEIESMQPKKEKSTLKRCVTQTDEDRLLEQRRIPVFKKRVRVRFLTFND